MAFPLLPAVGVGLSFLGNVMSSKSNKDTNRTNLQIARENNQWSEQMMQKQMDYNTLMWEKNNQYNSAAAQRARLEQAGLNPYLMMNGGSAGTATSASSPSLPSPTTPTMQPMRYDFSNVADSIADFQRVKIEQQTADSTNRLTDLQSDWYAAKSIAELGKIVAETDNVALKNKFQSIQNLFARDMMNQDYIRAVRENQQLEVNIATGVLSQIQMAQTINAFPERNRAEIENIIADTSYRLALGELTSEQARTEIIKRTNIALQNANQRVQNDILVKTANEVVERTEVELKRLKDPKNIWELGNQVGEEIGNFADDKIIKPSKKRWNKTKKSFKSTMYRSFGIKF